MTVKKLQLTKKTNQINISLLEDSEFYDKLERARTQTTNRVGLMSNALGEVQSLISILTLVAGLIYFEPYLIILLVLRGYRMSQNVIDSLNIKHPIYLLGDGHKVMLEVWKINKGMFSQSQALLKCAEPLKLGVVYRMQIDNLSDYHLNTLSKHNPERSGRQNAEWEVTSTDVIAMPSFLIAPKIKENQFKEYGCGPAVYCVFKMKYSISKPFLLQTELRNVVRKDTTIHSYYLPTNGNELISLGHGMCAGAFRFEARHKYSARFNLVDYNGNSTGEWTEWIEIENPRGN